ncbi:low-specificity L-threonine aldolase [Alginatibacterium sediminis]|uniref:Low-specificity L-threonine aldolase n=1 Tax=Alginatibacterium sediminis TaxID=2164068 RepID=A0A420E8I3_9ALTE|nr:low-specificity L-threonine aldolase [Alginatibacterium sediminis]RKF15776.1 low-specificity L-threonine aldolase [Alginatibacterium sediminis]
MHDFRSDTVTKPSDELRKIMAAAPVGDDVYGDDPSVNRLQDYAKEKFAVEAALFCSSGTQANLLALMSHCQRGQEYICGQQAHNYKYEAGGAAVLGSIQPQPIINQIDGSLAVSDIESAIKAEDFHFAQTRLVSLENTIGGKVLPQGYTQQVKELCDKRKLALHLDGARLFNASVKQSRSIVDLTGDFDSFTLCLSKGLGAPVGSLVLGSKDFIERATRLRKMLGGGMRQAGILAAAGQHVLENNVERLAIDHDNAMLLAQGLSQIEQLRCEPSQVQTNIVYAHCQPEHTYALANYLEQKGILLSAGAPIRFVTHLNVDQQSVNYLLDNIKAYFASN